MRWRRWWCKVDAAWSSH